jgi:hypothetical protein
MELANVYDNIFGVDSCKYQGDRPFRVDLAVFYRAVWLRLFLAGDSNYNFDFE